MLAAMQEYRVSLDTYNGPLDLLLYLIRRDEIDIYDIPIASITRQYVQYMEMIQQLDPNLAGEFLVLAATLMEIKTRLLLPPVTSEEGGETTAAGDFDPRAELVRQLLEYKAFKDAAGDLAAAATLRSQKFARKPFLPQADPTELDMEDVQVWDLLEAFGKVLESIGRSPGQHEVIYDDTPVELHAEDILDRLRGEGAMSFARLFEGRTSRSEIVGLFIALLELVRQKKVFAAQDDTFGEIAVQLNPDPPAATTEVEAGADAFIAGDQSLIGEDVVRVDDVYFDESVPRWKIQKEAVNRIRGKFLGKVVKNDDTGREITITGTGIDKTVRSAQRYEVLHALESLPSLLKGMKHVGSESPRPAKFGKPADRNLESVDRYEVNVRIRGKMYTANIVIKVRKTGGKSSCTVEKIRFDYYDTVIKEGR